MKRRDFLAAAATCLGTAILAPKLTATPHPNEDIASFFDNFQWDKPPTMDVNHFVNDYYRSDMPLLTDCLVRKRGPLYLTDYWIGLPAVSVVFNANKLYPGTRSVERDWPILNTLIYGLLCPKTHVVQIEQQYKHILGENIPVDTTYSLIIPRTVIPENTLTALKRYNDT